jgi:hypothetical protein
MGKCTNMFCAHLYMFILHTRGNARNVLILSLAKMCTQERAAVAVAIVGRFRVAFMETYLYYYHLHGMPMVYNISVGTTDFLEYDFTL